MNFSPPWTHSGKRIESAIRKALYDFKLIENGTALSIALSGGKDSITLLIMLKAILGKGFPHLPLYAIHIAGAFSCGASLYQGYLKGICDQLEVPLIIKESTQTLESLACYRCSRERRRLIFEAAKEVNAPLIAFGHHEDDTIQTLLMNLLHKGEFAGNLPKVPMHDYAVTIIRPMLYVPEETIHVFAEQQGFLRQTCQCPVGQKSKRMEVKTIIKELEESFPNAKRNLALAALNYGSTKALSSTKQSSELSRATTMDALP